MEKSSRRRNLTAAGCTRPANAAAAARRIATRIVRREGRRAPGAAESGSAPRPCREDSGHMHLRRYRFSRRVRGSRAASPRRACETAFPICAPRSAVRPARRAAPAAEATTGSGTTKAWLPVALNRSPLPTFAAERSLTSQRKN